MTRVLHFDLAHLARRAADDTRLTSAEMARVEEDNSTIPDRMFRVQATDGTVALVGYHFDADDLYCFHDKKMNDCEHTARVRLCGILTNSVTQRTQAGTGIVERKPTVSGNGLDTTTLNPPTHNGDAA